MQAPKSTVLALTLIALASAPAIAQTSKKGPPPAPAATSKATFDKLDKNKDGAIDAQEAKADARLAGQFAKLDANGDGKLSRVEFSAAK